jgi:hypothetical protein
MEQVDPSVWKKCNGCKKPIAYSQAYYVCNVSTCNRKRTGLVFCQVSCWDSHLPIVNHRESWAEERKAPKRDEWIQMLKEESEPKRREPRAAKPVEEVQTKVSAPARVIVRRGSGG